MPCHHHSLSWNKIRGYFPVHHGSFFLRRFSCVESPRKIWSSIDPDGNGVPRRLECLGCILLQTGGTRKQWDELSIFALDIAIGGSVSAWRFFLLQNLRLMIFPKLTSDATFLDEPKSRTSVNPSLPLYHHSWYIDPTDIPRPKFIVGPDPFIARHPRDPKGGTSMQELLQVLHRTVKINTSKNLRFFRI